MTWVTSISDRSSTPPSMWRSLASTRPSEWWYSTAPRISSWAASTSVSMESLMPNGRRVWRTIHWAPLASGPKIRTTHQVGIDRKRATSSARAMARVLGRISLNTTISTVITAVASSAPTGPGNAVDSATVVRAEAPMLMTLLESRMAPIIFS